MPKIQPIQPKFKSKFKKYVGSEDNFQGAVANYLDYVGAVYFHPPNGGSRNVIEASKLKSMGVKPGVPDLIILDSRHGFAGLAIELKVGSNNLTSHQITWLEKLNRLGWLCYVSWSLDEIISIIDWYFGFSKKNLVE